MRAELDDRQHETRIALLLLSLDAVATHAGALALGLRRPEQVKKAARLCAEWWVNPRENHAKSGGAVFAAMRARLDEVGAGRCVPRVATWLNRFLYAHSVQTVTDAWSAVLTRYGEPYRAPLHALGLSDESGSALIRLTREYAAAADAADAHVGRVEAAVVSPWDREQFVQYRRESELIAPTDYLAGWLHGEAVLTALGQISRTLDGPELRVFVEWAKTVATVEFRALKSRLVTPSLRELVDSYLAVRGAGTI